MVYTCIYFSSKSYTSIFRVRLVYRYCWYARPQLFFTCHLRPIGGRLPKNGLFKIGPDDLLYHLVFFNTFQEELKLPIKVQMEDV